MLKETLIIIENFYNCFCQKMMSWSSLENPILQYLANMLDIFKICNKLTVDMIAYSNSTCENGFSLWNINH